MVYWAIGNPCPDYNGDERKGDNLYTSSVVALEAGTGKMQWYYQFTPHDVHDWDAVQPMLLVDEQWQGRPRKLLLHGDRNGFFFVLDRVNGELLLARPIARVNWATGYGKDARPILTEHFDSTLEGALVCPSGGGGANWPSASYSPIAKLFFVRVSDSCALYSKDPAPIDMGNASLEGRRRRNPGSRSLSGRSTFERGRKPGNIACRRAAVPAPWRRPAGWSSLGKAAALTPLSTPIPENPPGISRRGKHGGPLP